MHSTKKALVLSGLTLATIYVLTYIEENFPNLYSATRSIASNATAYDITQPKRQGKISNESGTALEAAWAPRWQGRGETFSRSFFRSYYPTAAQHSNHNKDQSHWWCTQDSYDKSCRDGTHQLCNPKGLLFVKTPKTGSTTISKIVKRIVTNVAKRNHLPAKCQHREDHVSGAGLWYGNRDLQQSFLMASIRDPADRAMSRFFWSHVTRHPDQAQAIEDDFILHYLNKSTGVATGCTSKGQGGYQLNYITMSNIPEWSVWSPQSPTQVINQRQVEHLVKQAIQDYDFIIMNERMEESLVILQFLLGLETGDIVSLSYNVGGSYRYEHGRCKQLVKSHVSDGMKSYFEGAEWHAKNYGDYLLFAAVNRSIDLTIDEIGRSSFEPALNEFQRLKAKVNEICTQKVPFPCSSNGTVLFHTKQPMPHNMIASCIDAVVQKDHHEGGMEQSWHR